MSEDLRRYPIGSTIVEIDPEWQMPFISPARNLAEAHRSGIRPVTFADIEEFCKSRDLPLQNAVLTDESSDSFLSIPNNWRIVTGGGASLVLQLTMKGTSPGLIDIKEFPRVVIGTHDTLFTGVIIAQYSRKDNNNPISLQSYHDWSQMWSPLTQPEVVLKSSELYLADKNGSLQRR